MKIFLLLALIASFSAQTFAMDCSTCNNAKIAEDSLGNAQDLMNQIKVINDSREIYSENSPELLEAFGKIFVISKNGIHSHCTGNLTAVQPSYSNYGLELQSENSYITTSDHCFENTDFERSYIVFTKRDGTKIKRKFELKQSNKEKDYAILKIKNPISTDEIKPLMISEYSTSDIEIFSEEEDIPMKLTAAGFSSDYYKGDHGENLTYDQHCKIKYELNGKYRKTNCVAYPGASGGALVMTGADEEGNVQNFIIGINKSINPKNPKSLTTTTSFDLFESLVDEYSEAGLY